MLKQRYFKVGFTVCVHRLNLVFEEAGEHRGGLVDTVSTDIRDARPSTLLNTDLPSVIEHEIPAFLADQDLENTDTSLPSFTPRLSAPDTVYAVFVGTNDLGNLAFLTDSQSPGKVLRDYTSCIYNALDHLYAAGGRNFILMNTVPLHLAPQYANETLHGANSTRYYPDKAADLTMISERMHEETTSVNEIFKYRTPYEMLLSRRYAGAHLALFDTWRLFSDIYDDPAAYLNGSEPLTVEGWEHHCNSNNEECSYLYNNTSPDSFMWLDELHPSEQVHRILARSIVATMNGSSEYATYWSG